MIRAGSHVTIHYTLEVDGEVVESTAGREPLGFIQGAGEIVAGLEARLGGLAPGDRARFELPPEQGFGPSNPEAIRKVPRAVLDLPGDLTAGQTVTGSIAGDPFRGKVVALDDREITLDLNHPLAGKTLHFEVEVVAVSAPGPTAGTRR